MALTGTTGPITGVAARGEAVATITTGTMAVAAKLEPTDTVSAGLRDLLRETIKSRNDGDAAAQDVPPSASVDPDKLVGIWVSKVDGDGTITLVMAKEGEFTWSFDKTGKSGELNGEFGIYDSNLLVRMAEDAQMAGEVTFAEDSKLSFVLAGGPPGDPASLSTASHELAPSVI